MLKVVLTPFFFFILLAELALHTVLLLGQLVICTFTLFGTQKLHYECGLVVRVLDSGSDVRGFDPHHRRYFCFSARYFFNCKIHDIFSILIFHKWSDRFYLYFL